MRDYTLVGYEEDTDTNTYTVEGQAVIISNDGSTDALKLKINNIEVSVLNGEILGPDELNFGRFQSVKVTSAVAYRLFIYDIDGVN